MRLHPDFPIIEGHYRLTDEWTVDLPSRFNRRFEEGDLVIWKPGFTIWMVVWGNDDSESKEERLGWIIGGASSEAFDSLTEISGGMLRYSYRLAEDADDERQAAFYGYVLGEKDHVQMAIYFDSPEDLAEAEKIWRSITEDAVSAE